MNNNYYDELYHHGIKGQKWGIRRFQNKSGGLTSAGRSRYANPSSSKSNNRSSSGSSTKLTSSKRSQRVKTALKVTAGVAVAGLAVYGASKIRWGTKYTSMNPRIMNQPLTGIAGASRKAISGSKQLAIGTAKQLPAAANTGSALANRSTGTALRKAGTAVGHEVYNHVTRDRRPLEAAAAVAGVGAAGAAGRAIYKRKKKKDELR